MHIRRYSHKYVGTILGIKDETLLQVLPGSKRLGHGINYRPMENFKITFINSEKHPYNTRVRVHVTTISNHTNTSVPNCFDIERLFLQTTKIYVKLRYEKSYMGHDLYEYCQRDGFKGDRPRGLYSYEKMNVRL